MSAAEFRSISAAPSNSRVCHSTAEGESVMIKSFVTVLNLLLATALVYLGVTVFYSVVSARMEQGQLTAQNDRQVVSDNRSPRRSLVFYNAINRRNLFNIDRSRPTRTKPIQVEKLEQTRLKLKLWGTAIGSDGIEYAVIQSGREQQLYHLGDAVDRCHPQGHSQREGRVACRRPG